MPETMNEAHQLLTLIRDALRDGELPHTDHDAPCLACFFEGEITALLEREAKR